MDRDEFVRAVQEALKIAWDRAERAIEATLRTLADRLSVLHARHLVTLLPPELGPLMFRAGPAERFDVDAFLERVAEREGVDLTSARRDAAMVLAVLARAIGPDEFDHLASTLPKDFTPLLPRGPAIDAVPIDTFLTKVAQRSDLDAADACRAAEVVLEILAERIAPGEVDDLIARLPIELHPALKRARSRNPGRATHIGLHVFLCKIAQLENTDLDTSTRHASAVLTTLRDAVGDDEFFDVTVQLPPEFGALWARQ
jgi:uncharacterized protein (DUF2267 family)